MQGYGVKLMYGYGVKCTGPLWTCELVSACIDDEDAVGVSSHDDDDVVHDVHAGDSCFADVAAASRPSRVSFPDSYQAPTWIKNTHVYLFMMWVEKITRAIIAHNVHTSMYDDKHYDLVQAPLLTTTTDRIHVPIVFQDVA